MAAAIDLEPIKVVGTLDKDPMKVPIGVLLAATITDLICTIILWKGFNNKI